MTFRFTGHETFACRYAWLPKAFDALQNPLAFADEEEAMVRLGVGKNMFRAIRFWVQVAGIATQGDDRTINITDFGQAVLARDGNGHDPFLEDIRTLWLLHWKISTQTEDPLFAWHHLLFKWANPEFSRSQVLHSFKQEAAQIGRNLSDVTLAQHFDVFLHTYIPTKGPKGDVLEDNLDSPLVELELIQKVGERALDKTGKREAIYSFRREEKPEISAGLFLYCLHEFWKKHHSAEQTLSLRNITIGANSPGEVFKLPEWEVRQRLVSIHRDSDNFFQYEETAAFQHVIRRGGLEQNFLGAVYQ